MKLTVLLCVQNGMPFLPMAVESIIAQSYADYKFLIINNSSTDGTLKYLNTINDKRVEIRNYDIPGIVEAHNYGLNLIKTEYTAIMDSDDYSEPDRLKKQLEFLESNPETGMVGTSISYIGESTDRRWVLHFPNTHDVIIREMLKGRFVLAHPSIMFRTEIAKQINGYRQESVPVPDLDFFLRFSKMSKLANVAGTYHLQRIMSRSYTHRNLKNVISKKYELLKPYCAVLSRHRIGSPNLEYLSVALYKTGLLKYLDGSNILWMFYFLVAALLDIPKTLYRMRTLIN